MSGETAAGITVALTVFCMVLGSASVPELVGPGRKLRWIALLALAALSAGLAVRGRRQRLGRSFVVVVALAAWLVGLSLVSTAWSVDPHLTFGRAASLALLLVVAVGMAVASRTRPVLPSALLGGILAGAVATAAAGLVLLAVGHGEAVQQATASYGARYRGLGANPDTASMLEGVALPIVLWLSVRAHTHVGKALSLAAAVLLLGSIGGSGSRGGLIAALVGGVVFALALPAPWRRRLVLALAVAVAVAGAGGISRIPRPLTPSSQANRPGQGAGSNPTDSVPIGAPVGTREQQFGGVLGDELFRFNAGKRSFLTSSGRLQAWWEAFKQAENRPFVGYGFGTEEKVFLDRVYNFQGAHVENSFVGMLLQLGFVGLASLLALLAAVWWNAARAVRRNADARLAPLVAMVASGTALMLVQSYIYSAGNIASVAVWIAIFAATALATGPAAHPADASPAAAGEWRAATVRIRGAVLVSALALLFVGAALVVVGRWERGLNADRQNAEMAAVFHTATAKGVVSPLLDFYRLTPAADCLLYHPPGRPTEYSDYELCFDAEGRLVETIDRHTGLARFGSLLESPSLATLTVPVPTLVAALGALGAAHDPRLAGTGLGAGLPLGFDDHGLHRYKTHGSAGSPAP